jgi:putative hydrolase of the HAD superfamily
MNHILPKGILFDLDDTILAFASVADQVWRDVCDHYAEQTGWFLSDDLFQKIREMSNWYWSNKERHKEGRKDLAAVRRIIVKGVFDDLGISAPELANRIADDFSVKRLEAVHLLPGAEETLEYLTKQDIALALITNGEARMQREKIDRFNLERHFKTILIEEELGYGKPEPEFYLRAITDLDLEPKDVWSVGDNLEWEVEAPQKLGIYSIWIDYRGNGLPQDSKVKPDRIINSISELVD